MVLITSLTKYSALLALAIPAALAGWFYWANYTIWGNPLHMDGFSRLGAEQP